VSHTGTSQSVAVPQSPSITHPTHAPLPSQNKSMFAPHIVLAGSGGFEGVPLEQTSSVHSRPSTGRSISSFASTAAPSSQANTLQSPGLFPDTGVPFVAGSGTHWPSVVHALTKHSLPGSGQSSATTHAIEPDDDDDDDDDELLLLLP
jgi:hypothetical protein